MFIGQHNMRLECGGPDGPQREREGIGAYKERMGEGERA